VSVADVPERRRGRTRAATLGGGAPLFLHRLRREPGVPLAMFLLVGATCFLFAALPLLFNGFADDGLRYRVAHAAPFARNVLAVDWGR
jgi:hypothetical protein